jgi:hypothetical protein
MAGPRPRTATLAMAAATRSAHGETSRANGRDSERRLDVIFHTVDSGSTTFTLLVPRVNMHAGESIAIRTDGITALHRFSIAPVLHGQLDFYTVHPLSGTASHVVF